MFTAKLSPPTRFSPQEQHNAYGLQNWFLLAGVPITSHELQQEIMDNFCNEQGFKNKGKNNLQTQINFINNRFPLFVKWANKNYKLKNKKQ